MASAALASQNESSWPQSGGGYMGKIPSSYPKKKKQKQFHAVTNVRENNDEPPSVTQTASDDAYSFNNFNASTDLNLGSYNTFNISSYNKIELDQLRKRLASELDQIRSLRDRIESKPSRKLPSFNGNNNMEVLMKECRKILTKLMKHKESWVFNVPVDDVALGLHDYHKIVKKPMDLGTVKLNFNKKLYLSPVEFADDVKLTFNNALLYNPKNDPVHGMAERLLVRFEELFKPIQDQIHSFRGDFRRVADVEYDSSERIKKPKASPRKTAPLKKLDRLQSRSNSSASTPSHPPLPPMRSPSPVKSPSPSPSKSQAAVNLQISGRGGTTKLPKPRAKDPDKREMNVEEKHKLGVGLQSLPQEKMPQLVQIIRKRNEHLAQDGDEIELDIEALDTETLWELDRFVTNWKKLVSKTKRQALLMNLNPGNGAASTSAADIDAGADVSEKNDYVKRAKKGRDDLDEDDVDIEDDMPVTSFQPVEIEKDEAGGSGYGGGGGDHEENGNNAGSGGDSSSSSSSGSDSSSSSDSDSGSSSGSESDEDEAQS